MRWRIVLALAAASFAWLPAPASAADFSANSGSLGAIPDGTDELTSGPDKVVAFDVTGVSTPVTDVRVSITVQHTWVGDLTAELVAPGGTSRVIFEATGFDDGSNLDGTYVFTDSAAASPSWFQRAAELEDDGVIPSGSYRASDVFGANTLITPAFDDLDHPNGRWKLRLTDSRSPDTGEVFAAKLTVNGAADANCSAPTLTGSDSSEILTGTPGNDVIAAGAGNDTVFGGGGNDILCGGGGNDVLVGGAGNDQLVGGAGADHLKGGSGRDFCKGGSGVDTARRCEATRSL